jgi:hypothetical protein
MRQRLGIAQAIAGAQPLMIISELPRADPEAPARRILSELAQNAR